MSGIWASIGRLLIDQRDPRIEWIRGWKWLEGCRRFHQVVTVSLSRSGVAYCSRYPLG
jgi:hypothetical protein